MPSYADIIKKKKRDWDCADLMDGAKRARGAKLPFSSPCMNFATYGGIPRNQITEFFGNPGGGKSTTAVDICKNAANIFKQEYEDDLQKLIDSRASGGKAIDAAISDLQERGPKKVLYLDLEHSFDGAWAETLGIEEGSIDIMQPPNVVAEDILTTVHELIETNELGLVVLDSIPSLVTRQELEKAYGDRTVASLAGLLTVFFRKIVPVLTRYNTTLLIINQIRDNMDNPYVVNTPGGKALKFYCSLRINFTIGSPVDFAGNEIPTNSENPAGYKIKARLAKQKSAPWDRKEATYYLMAQSGIRADMDITLLAINNYGYIAKSGGWFMLSDPETGEALVDDAGKPMKLHGLPSVVEYVRDHPEYFKKLSDAILSDMKVNPNADS